MRTSCTLLLAAVIGSVLGSADAAAQGQSHMLQAPAEHVVLRDEFVGPTRGDDDPCPTTSSFHQRRLFRIHPNGARDAAPFVVSDGRLLIVTDVEWAASRALGANPLPPGATIRLQISLASSPSQSERVFFSRTAQVGNLQGPVGTSEQLTTGFAVAAHTGICPMALQLIPNGSATVPIKDLVLRGYLVNEF